MENINASDEESVFGIQAEEVFPISIKPVVASMNEKFTARYLEKSEWIKYPDENSDHFYYYNEATEESVWESDVSSYATTTLPMKTNIDLFETNTSQLSLPHNHSTAQFFTSEVFDANYDEIVREFEVSTRLGNSIT